MWTSKPQADMGNWGILVKRRLGTESTGDGPWGMTFSEVSPKHQIRKVDIQIVKLILHDRKSGK